MEDNKMKLVFASIDKTVQNQIPSNKEGEARGKNFVTWGDNNDYPNFLYQLTLDCPYVSTIINGSADYVTGDEITSPIKNKPNPIETWEDFMSKLAIDYFTFGLFYIQVIRDNAGKVKDLYHLDARFVRMDEYNEMFYYNKEFGKKYGRTTKTVIYPKFLPEAVDIPSSVLCVKTPSSRGVYGTPLWGSAVKSVVTEVEIDRFHLNEVDNNFSASAVINFPNGIPTEEEADKIEADVYEKFTGSENAGRFLLNFCNGKDNAATVERLGTDDFDKRYESLEKKTQKQIFASFGASPVLFGIERDNTGFSDEDFKTAFKLYNRTRIKPVQKKIIDGIDYILGTKGSIAIAPYSIDWGETDNNGEIN